MDVTLSGRVRWHVIRRQTSAKSQKEGFCRHGSDKRFAINWISRQTKVEGNTSVDSVVQTSNGHIIQKKSLLMQTKLTFHMHWAVSIQMYLNVHLWCINCICWIRAVGRVCETRQSCSDLLLHYKPIRPVPSWPHIRDRVFSVPRSRSFRPETSCSPLFSWPALGWA